MNKIVESKTAKVQLSPQLSEVPKKNSSLSPQDIEAKTLRETVSKSLEVYFSHLDDHEATNIYDMVISEVEPSLFRAVLKHTQGNQTKAAEVLGVNRGTLRKKLKLYNIS